MNGDSDLRRTKQVPAFVGVSTTDSEDDTAFDEHPSLQSALDRACQLAAGAGLAGERFHLTIEIVPEEHNQWVRTYRAIITGEK